VGEVAVRASDTDPFRRLAVGRRPVALAFDSASHRLYVANEFDDSVSVLDLSDARDPRVVGTISLGPCRTLTKAERGEELFYDARLSLDGWFSCHSCHTDGHACGLLNDNHTDGSFGTPKRILSLLGTADTGPWAWYGHMISLEEQARMSITSTMQGNPQQATDENTGALAEYLRTLIAPPSVATARGTVDQAAADRGRRVFEESDCSRCHIPPDYTAPRTADVGLADETGHTHFNPPSLRGLTQRPAYFHDNRAGSLREVFTRYKHPDGQDVDPAELEDLLRFLESL
jgi:cytochrome c peroxidase